MSKNDLKTNELEHDIQRFMQIRDQIHEEIKKIGAHASTLDETNKRLIAHFDVFKEISENSEEQIYDAIKGAAHEMAKESIRCLSPLLESLLGEQLLTLKHSMATAERVLYSAMDDKNTRPFFYSLLQWSFLLAVGFGLRGLIPTSSSDVSDQILQKIDYLDQKIEKALSKNRSPEIPRIKRPKPR